MSESKKALRAEVAELRDEVRQLREALSVVQAGQYSQPVYPGYMHTVPWPNPYYPQITCQPPVVTVGGTSTCAPGVTYWQAPTQGCAGGGLSTFTIAGTTTAN